MDAAGVDSIVYSSSAAVYGCVAGRAGDRGRGSRAREPVRPDQARRRVAPARRGARLVACAPSRCATSTSPAPAGRSWVTRSSRTWSPASWTGSTRGAAPAGLRHRLRRRADGTCVRDYVHVLDLARAPTWRALDRPRRAAASPRTAYNVGRGRGASVLEVLALLGEVSGLDTTPEVVGRGGPATPRAWSPPSTTDPRRSWAGARELDLRDDLSSAWAAWQVR